MKRNLSAWLAAAGLCSAAWAQQVTPVWVQHLNGLVNVAAENQLPILVKAGGSGDDTYGFDGTDVIDSYISFVKYDDDYYLLGVRENGIDETKADLSQELKDRAAAFPDRSVIWIDAKTGKSLGVALKTEVLPVPLATQAATHAWWKFGIQDGAHGQRAIYTGYKYKVLRYAPAALADDPNFPQKRATWSATPTQAWVEPVPGEPSGDESSGGDGSASWRLKHFRVFGAGNDTRLWIGGGTWRASMQPQELTTTDGGLTFQPVARMNDRNDNRGEKGQYSQGGQPSAPVAWPTDTARPGLKVSYQPHYPGAGWDARPTRHTLNPNGDGTLPREGGTGRPDFYEYDHAGSDTFPKFNWEAAGKDGIPIDHAKDGVNYYDGNWVMTCDAAQGLDYVVTYAIPSWNQQFGSIFKPGWIGVHTLDGMIASGASSFKLPVYETDEPIVDPNGNGGTGHDYGYDGSVIVYPAAGAPANSGKSLVLWAGGIYGFGVFELQNTAATIVTQPASGEATENSTASLVAVVNGSPNHYQWYKDNTALVAGEKYRATLTEGVNKATLTVLNAQVADSGSYVLKVTNPLGNVETQPAVLTVKVDQEPPTITGVKNGRSADSSYIAVTYSESVTPETAGNATNYKLSGGATVSSALVTGATSAVIYTSTLTPDVEYTLTVSGVRDVASNGGNAIAANTQVKVKGPVLTAGTILWEMYRGLDNAGIAGGTVDLLEADPSFPSYPSRWEYMTSVNTDANGLSQAAESFGGRISGWITPTESGQYRFFIRSDDGSRLYLSSNDNPSGASMIAWENGCCKAFLEPTAVNPDNNESQQTSDAINLQANTSYYLAALYKEGGGGDWCQLAWRKEGDETPAASLTPIPGSFFKAYRTAATEPPKFNAPTLAGGNVTLSWTGTGTLQESVDLNGWTGVAGNPASPYSVPANAAPHKFYRLVQ